MSRLSSPGASRSNTPLPHDPLASTSSTPYHNPGTPGSSFNQIASSPPRKRQRTRTIVDHPDRDQLESRQPATCNECCTSDVFFEVGTIKGKGNDCLDENLDFSSNRDERFYFPEADCVIQVENTLFRVHKFVLARDSSAFQDMFSLPMDQSGSCDQSPRFHEGTNDKNPIKLFGDTAEDFRIMLSLLYSLPPELQIYQTSSAPVPQLLTLTSILNKYHFATTSIWALSALYDVLSGKHGTPLPPHDVNNPQCIETLLERIVEVACVCGHAELRDFIEERWCARICTASGSLMGIDAYRREREARWAVHVADKWELTRLAGVAYYTLLLETNGAINQSFSFHTSTHDDSNTANEPQPDPWIPPALTKSQTVRLLVGHRSLILLGDQLRSTTPTFPRPDGCVFHVHGCLSAWSTAWREVSRSETTLYKFKSCDIIGKLKSMEEQIMGNTDLQCALTPVCRRRAMSAVRELRESISKGLSDHFVDITREVT
ncbi:hypothetical protein QCA50_006785 [Cerrena zonata]|uniref:BTB domain-containing protein n=1 Tax=Cerrena zonata TaxID=2478898 RepID=A0AAW0GKP5_9APHY